MSNEADDECPGEGKCHGCMKWCSTCGDVAHVCDARLRGDRCDEHPIPLPWSVLRTMRSTAEKKITEGKAMVRDGERELEGIQDVENARRAYDKQLAALDRLVFNH